MKWPKRILALVALLLLGAFLVITASVLLSLDWSRAHNAETAALPRLGEAVRSGDESLVQIDANGMTFRARVGGLENDGPGLVLLHGFPETSAMWGPLFDAAVAAGFRVVAFDQRGYSPGARPDDAAAYVLAELIGDVIAIADAVGFEQFHLVGHDWGCVVGWSVVIQHPERVLTWSGLSIPHPGTLLSNLREELPAYIKIFTAPFVPEAMLGWNDFSMLREWTYTKSTTAQRDEYMAVFSEPGALTGALDWYRAIATSLGDAESLVGPVEGVPTLFLWGTREGWVTDEALELQRELVDAPYAERELDAGHFLMQDRPDEVVSSVMAHVLAGAPSM
jgi:pimeloyl-ACP methyl ester carboxylesterase